VIEPAVTAPTQQSQVVEVVWDDPVARYMYEIPAVYTCPEYLSLVLLLSHVSFYSRLPAVCGLVQVWYIQ